MATHHATRVAAVERALTNAVDRGALADWHRVPLGKDAAPYFAANPADAAVQMAHTFTLAQAEILCSGIAAGLTARPPERDLT